MIAWTCNTSLLCNVLKNAAQVPLYIKHAEVPSMEVVPSHFWGYWTPYIFFEILRTPDPSQSLLLSILFYSPVGLSLFDQCQSVGRFSPFSMLLMPH